MFSGIINLRKPPGVTSADCVSFVKRLFGGAKVGHGGTLDPFATGVLPIGVNGGTRLLNSFLEGDKGYSGSFRLFVSTDTLDCEGVVTELSSFCEFEPALVQANGLKFVGEYNQQPPAYSARRINGKRLYELARTGKKIPELPPRLVRISELNITPCTRQTMSFSVTCSKGTYVRQLIRDILAESGYIGVLEELIRQQVAGLYLADSISFSELFELVMNDKVLIGSAFHRL